MPTLKEKKEKFINELQLCTEYFAVMIFIFLYKEKIVIEHWLTYIYLIRDKFKKKPTYV